MQSNFSVIEGKLNDFINKFYLNRIVIGVVLSLLFAIVSFFTVSMVESVAFMSPFTKTLVFYFLVFILASIFIFFVLIPLFKYLKIIPFLTQEEAAEIISNHFPESQDLLINILQLNSNNQSDILVAAINQKISLISPLNFVNAINFKKTSKFLFVSLGILALLIAFGSIFNRNFSQGSHRFWDYSTYYVPENPYSIEILNDSLYCAYGDDFTLRLKSSGPSILQDIFISADNFSVRMNSDSADCFSYTLRNVTSDIEFSFNYLDFVSEKHQISVVHRPNVTYSNLVICPPEYTGLDVISTENFSDFTAPFGSTLTWAFNVSHATIFNFYIDSTSQEVKQAVENLNVVTRALKPFDYYYSAVGEGGFLMNSNLFHVNLLPDYSPQIVAVSAVDSSSANGVFFSGHISDDYGFHSLCFKYFDSNNPKDIHSADIELRKGVSQDFYYYFDFSNLSKSVSYYFEVRDNDPISGFKSAKTPLSVYTTITNEEKQERVENLNSSIFDKIDQAQRLLRELNSDLNDFQKNVTSNDQISDWEKQLKIDNLMQKQEKLSDLMNDLSQDNMSKNAFENQLNQNLSQELLEKQKQLQEMWEGLMTEDIKELLDRIEEMKEVLSEKNLRDNIQELRFDFNQISEQLDRNSELMKMYNIDNKLHNLSDDLKKMSEKYKDLANEMKSQKGSKSESLSEKMQEFSKDFNKLDKEYSNLLKQNEQLGNNKLDLQDLEKQFEQLTKELDFQKNEVENLEKDLGLKPENSDLSNPDRANADQNSSNSNEDKDGNISAENKKIAEQQTEKGSDSNDSDAQNDANSGDSDSDKSDSAGQNMQNSSDKNQKSGDSSDKNNQKSGDNSDKNDQKSGSDFNKNDQKSGSDSNKNGSNNANEKQRRQNISQQMEQTSEEMEDLSKEMNGLKKKNQQKKRQENLNDIRQILDNLVAISFNQEKLIDNLNKNTQTVYMQTDLLRDQNAISKDFALVQDSIYALAKRSPEFGHEVYTKIDHIHTQFGLVTKAVDGGSRANVSAYMQTLLTYFNDLSLIFNQISDDMQKQQQEGEEGEDSEESVETRNKKENQRRQQRTQQMKSQQQMLKQQLQKMLQQLQNGDKMSSQQLAEALRQQEMMMQQLQEIQNGKGVSQQEQQLMNQIQQMMEENKRDIVNKNITKRLVDRQNLVFNKLLDLEKAEKEQDYDDKRESKQGFDFQNNNSQNLNLKLKDFGVKEFIHSSPLNLNLYYQEKYNNYIQNLD